MRAKRKPSQGSPARVQKAKKNRADRSSQSSQYTTPQQNLKAFDIDSYCWKADKAIADCFVMGLDFLSQIKFSFFIGRDGRLMTRGERRGAK
ncbi:MAG: hypothetical protein WCI90_07825 [Chlorobium sp.]|nr:MAG: hypothetical protein FDX17_00775 [Chlorobium sp.]